MHFIKNVITSNNTYAREKQSTHWSTYSILDPDYYNGYDHPYGEPGYGDYDYGDYNEGVGLYPAKKLTISQRVAKWFSGFKIPSTKVIYEHELSTKIIIPNLMKKTHISYWYFEIAPSIWWI